MPVINNYRWWWWYYFQYVVVNGGWSSWLEWSECSVSCEGGTKTRDRTCDNPAPDTDGTPCAGSNTETTNCNNKVCPGNLFTVITVCVWNCISPVIIWQMSYNFQGLDLYLC